jgi:hypothetical protein
MVACVQSDTLHVLTKGPQSRCTAHAKDENLRLALVESESLLGVDS